MGVEIVLVRFAHVLGENAGGDGFIAFHDLFKGAGRHHPPAVPPRPWPEIHIGLAREQIGDVATENIVHFFRTLAIEARMALHVDLIRGDNDHHRAEAAFKATALALRSATEVTGVDILSPKGTLTGASTSSSFGPVLRTPPR